MQVVHMPLNSQGAVAHVNNCIQKNICTILQLLYFKYNALVTFLNQATKLLTPQ